MTKKKKTILALCTVAILVVQAQATLISFLEEDSLAGVDGDTTGWSSNDSMVVLSTSTWSLLGGTAAVYGYIDGESILTHRGTRGLGIDGMEGDEVDYSLGRPEKIAITFTIDSWVNSLEVRSLFTNDGWSPGIEVGTVDFYLDGFKIYTEDLEGLEPLGGGNDGDVAVSYPTPFLVDKLEYYVPTGLGNTTTESEFAVARLDVTPIPEPTTVGLLGFGSLALLCTPGKRKKM